MRRRLLLLAGPVFFLFLIATSLYLGRDEFPSPSFLQREHQSPPDASRKTADQVAIPVQDGAVLSAANITTYLDAILDRKETALPTLDCPAKLEERYKDLKVHGGSDAKKLKYLFALDLRQVVSLLPRLIGSVVEAARFLGPTNCAISIVEGTSKDGTPDVLLALRPELERMGISYYFNSSDIDSSKGDRIGRLAQLRNLALQPLTDNSSLFAKDSTVIFLNDVAACPDDILELIFQRRHLQADMTCAMDWTHAAAEPTFYDVWIARAINGDTFFEIPPNGSWGSAWNLFWSEPNTKSRFAQKRPFQVFSCWNGAAAFSAEPILEDLRFRKPLRAECMQGEPELFCKDLWLRGRGKIAVIPSINLEYTISKGRKIKKSKGFTTDIVKQQDLKGDTFDWQLDPPEKVRCMPTYDRQSWKPWNEAFVKKEDKDKDTDKNKSV